ncbi:hypothetical protein AC578_10 [Pseudocercospora eumusae]|uniref:Uncharacterized protein n=1 Tax=Pseudocercospora eumusae TaxID=321146 RepID=A0A139GUT1_9PEZI|nr:hypothetical protein AC578_10 [Pseudocercospora eumusae]
MARKRTRKPKQVVSEPGIDLLRLSNEVLVLASDNLDKQALFSFRLVNHRLNDIVQRSLRSRKTVLYLQGLRSSIQTFNKIIKFPAFANNITTIVYIAKRYDSRSANLAKVVERLSSRYGWSKDAPKEFLQQYKQEFLASASSTVESSLYEAVKLLPNVRNITVSTRFEADGFNFDGSGGETGQSIAMNRDSRWPLGGEKDEPSVVDRIWRTWRLDSQLDTAIPVIKAIAKHAELYPEKRLIFGLNQCPAQILNKEVMDFGKFDRDYSDIENPVFVRAAAHVKSFLLWEEHLSKLNRQELDLRRRIAMAPTRNYNGWYGVAWRRLLRELVNLEHFEMKGCAEDRTWTIENLCGPVLNQIGHFAKLRHVSIEAGDYFLYPAPRYESRVENMHFQTKLLQNFILAHSHTLEELSLDCACGRQTYRKALSVDERRGLLLAIRDQCKALNSLKIQEWVKLSSELKGPGDLEPYLSWRRRLEAEMPIVQLAMEFGAKRVYEEKGVEVLEEMSAEQTVIVSGDMTDKRDEQGEEDVPQWFCYRFDVAALKATMVAE